MTPQQIRQYRKKLEELYKRANALCAVQPDVDRDVLIQSWRMQDETPLQKIETALRRGQAFIKSWGS